MITLGVFDSGIGGLSMVEACEKGLPGARILYVADTAHQPYGQKTPAQVAEYSLRICEFLQAQGAQAVLVACSTASAVAVPLLRKSLTLPVLGLLDSGWAQEALRTTRNRRIGILATTLTTQNGSFARSLEEQADGDVRIFGQAAPDLIARISEGRVQEDVLIPAIRVALAPLLEKGIDTLVVGCTHFNFILPQLQRIAGDGVHIVNPRDWVVKKLAPITLYPTPPSPYKGEGTYYATGDARSFETLARRLWRADATFHPLELIHA